ncbi:membrane protein insertase YidC [Stagnihabitans tardus]|uniref:Membrane protein insertase YidC n=1 Tax=Stagnihabitans tardus TaxID=2699202 RepID=A0AAE4YBP8_9RHOB|nr:membrane protein insertase YidC [Stagnihabitans tardus]NBZ89716.1 membrane protein insertase YidC [Stagnihabitans tardus]
MEDQNKNLLLATVLSAIVILVWFIAGPMLFPDWFPKEDTTLTALPADQAVTPAATDTAAPAAALTEAPAVEAPRLTIDTPKLSGSVSLLGGRIDDLLLKTYRTSVAPDAAPVTLLSAVGQEKPYYAIFGFSPGNGMEPADVPDAKTIWTQTAGDTLAPGKPVTLTWANTKGVTFTRDISVDENFMFTIVDTVTNKGTAEARLAPYGIIARHGLPKLEGVYVVHEGPVSRIDGKTIEQPYSDLPSLAEFEGVNGQATESQGDGWTGFTDHYWMTTLIPEQGQPFTAVEKYTPGADIYQVEVRKPVLAVAPGASATTSMRFFAGAKEWETIAAYENDPTWYMKPFGYSAKPDVVAVPGFVNSIDWGWFFFLTKPIFFVLHLMHGLIGNMGLAIIGLTFILKLIVLPLAYKSYVSMARMKELQPEMEALKERAGEDKQKLQKEMMQLYREKKVNPAAGCLPIFLQIPIFFSLYKVIYVTIELRHAPFVGWLTDLSMPDTSSIFNAFSLLPWDAPATGTLLHTIFIGLLPILLGISMWLQQKLNPAPTDPAQAMIMTWMPWVFMFMLGSFASGLVLYWITNNTITFIQQYLIMWSHGNRPDLLGNFRRKAPVPVPVSKPKAKK